MTRKRKNISARYRREEKRAHSSKIGSTFEELKISKAANRDLRNENNKLQSELAEQRTINDELMTSIKSHQAKITEFIKTAEYLQKKVDEAKSINTMTFELLKFNMEILNSSSNVKTKLKRQVSLLRRRLRRFKGQKETSEKLLQEIRQKCKHIFNSQFHPDFLQANSNLITSVVELYDSHSHSDRINFCPAIQYMKTVPNDITSSAIKNVAYDSATPSKRRKIDNSTHVIEKRYSHKSLKVLVMNLEKRHSDNYQLWRNVLWALHKYGSEQGYDTLEIANCFSQRSKKYKNLEDVRETFESSNGTLSLQYLIEISKIYEEDLDALSDCLSRKVPVAYLPFVIRQMDVRDRRKFRLIVDCAEESQTLFIIPELFVLTDENDKRLCFLGSSVTSKTSELASLSPHMKDGYIGKFYENHYVFRARYKPSATVELWKPWNPAESHIILPNGREDKKESHLAKIRMLLRTKALRLLWLKTKKQFGDEEDDSNIVVIPDEEPDEGLRSDEELVEALFSANPSLKSIYCYSAKTIYYCSPNTNLWSKLSETEFDSHLRKHLTTTLQLNKAELKSIGMTDTIVNMRNMILGKNIVSSNSLDSNLNLFVTLNKTVDTTRVPPVIRNIEKDDMAEKTCGWSYDRQMSEEHMEAVRSYFDKLFPQKSERKWFLSFVAKLLSGRSMDGYFLVLHDKNENKDVTSKLMTLLATVFGNYSTYSYEIEESEGGSLENLKGKRLLVAEKLHRHYSLYCPFIKDLTDQKLHYYQYRDKFSQAHEFPLVAGLITIFTEGDVPQFNKNDQDLVKRMVVIPMRSQFVSKNEYDELVKKGKDMTDIYIADDTPDFQEWSSAVLDLLIENYSVILPVIPDSMVASNKKLCLNSRNYDFYDWLTSNLCADEDKQAFVSLTQIVTQIKKTHEFNPRHTNTLRLDMSKWAKSKDFQYKASHEYVSNKRKRTCKSVIMGVSFAIRNITV